MRRDQVVGLPPDCYVLGTCSHCVQLCLLLGLFRVNFIPGPFSSLPCIQIRLVCHPFRNWNSACAPEKKLSDGEGAASTVPAS
jgi:hypothetical protein